MADSAVVSTVFALEDKMSAGLAVIGRGVAQLRDQVSTTTGKLELLNSASNRIALSLGAVGSVWAGGAIIKDVIKLNQEFEDTGLRIAGSLRAFDLAPTIGIAEKQAAQAMKIIQDMAAPLPGSAEEYVTVFATALPKAIAAGMRSTTQIAKFTSSWMAVAASNQVDAQQAGMDLFRLLSGQAGADVKMFTVLSEKIGMTADEYNKLIKKDPTQSVKMLQKALANYADQQSSAASKFSAKLGEFESRIAEIKRLAGNLLFEKAKDGLIAINNYLEENRYSLIKLGKELGERVIKGFTTAAQAVKYIADNIDTVIALSTTLAGIWITGTLAGALLNIANLFKAVTTAAVATQAATTAMGGATALQSALALGGAGGALAGAATGQVVVKNIGTMILSAGATAALAGALTLFYGSAGAGRRELDWEAERREQQQAEDDLRRKYATTITQLNQQLEGTPGGARDPLQAYRGVYETLTAQLRGPLSPAALAEVAKQRNALLEYAVERGLDISEILPAPAIKRLAAPTDRKTQTFDFRNSRFDIKQQFAEGFDPDRIAVAFAQDLARVGEQKTQSAYTTPATVR